jgi:hypothetical protein
MIPSAAEAQPDRAESWIPVRRQESFFLTYLLLWPSSNEISFASGPLLGLRQLALAGAKVVDRESFIKDRRSFCAGNSHSIRCIPINTLSEQAHVKRCRCTRTPNIVQKNTPDNLQTNN